MIVKIKKLCPEANVPTQKPGDAGWDLYCSKRVAVSMGETVVLPVGVALEIPLGWYGQIKGRSGLASRGFIVHGGVIDSGYRGEIKVTMTSRGSWYNTFMPGDRVAQLVFLPVPQVEWAEVDELEATSRGEGGFGSTGR